MFLGECLEELAEGDGDGDEHDARGGLERDARVALVTVKCQDDVKQIFDD